MSEPGNTTIAAEGDRTSAGLLWLQAEMKKSVRMMLTRIEAGMSVSCAVQDSLRELDVAYKAACKLDGVQFLNASLDPCSVSLQARFALDAVFLALKGGCNEHDARKSFWAIMRKCTQPSLTV